MAKTIQFDYEKALNKATLLFWKKGYKNTSLKEILNVTGLGEGSFYNTLKSKKALYLACMNHYNEVVTKTRLDAFLKASSVKQGIKDYFDLVIQGLENDRYPKGCLMANGLYADVLQDRTLRKYISEGYEMFEALIAQRFAAAKKSGELPANFDSASTAELLVTFLQGLFRVSLITKTPQQCRLQSENFLKAVGLNVVCPKK